MLARRLAAIGGCRAFSSTPIALKVGAYSLFMIENKKNAALQGLKIAARGKATAKLYNALSVADRTALETRAAKHAGFKRHSAAPKKKRAASPYNKFVAAKSKLPEIQKLPFKQRLSAIAKLWNKQ